MKRFALGSAVGAFSMYLFGSAVAQPQAQETASSLPPIFEKGAKVRQGKPRLASKEEIAEVKGEWIRFVKEVEFGETVWVHVPTGTSWTTQN